MIQILIYTIVILVGIIMIAVFYFMRISNFRFFSEEQLIRSQPYIWIVFGTLFLTFAIYLCFFAFDKIFPENASFQGMLVERMFYITLVPTGIVFLVTHILLFYIPYKHRSSLNKNAAYIIHNIKLELI